MPEPVRMTTNPVLVPVAPNPKNELKIEVHDLEAKAKNAEIRAAEIVNETKETSLETYKKAMEMQTTFMNPSIWTQIRAMGKIFFESKALPKHITNEAQLVMTLQAGFEMGMSPIESIKSTYMINGTISIYGAATTKRFREHGWNIAYLNETEESCTAQVSKGDEMFQETFTYKMAEDSGYTKSRTGDFKVGWLPGVNRKLKMRYGALSIITKSYIPEILGPATDIAEIAEDYPAIEAKEAPKLVEKNANEKVIIEPMKTATLAEKLADSKKPKVIDQPVKTGEKGGK